MLDYMDINSTVGFTNGVEIPRLGLGVFKSQPGEETETAVRWALEAGYRHVDTAAFYRNEVDVGRAVNAGIVPREDVFVTSKLWPDDFGYDAALRAFDTTLRELGLPVLDLYLLHWPRKGMVADSWKALETIYKEGRVRAIGVSNFEPHHIDELMETVEVPPVINQVELSPYLPQMAVREYCRDHGIVVEAWSPLSKGAVLNDPVINEIARRHGKTAVQVTVRWHMQHDIVVIPKSVKRERIVANADVFDFTLSDSEMAEIDGLDRGEDGRTGPHPDTIDFWD